MSDLPRAQLIGYLVAGVAVVVLGALWVRGGARPGEGTPVAAGAGVQVRASGGGKLVVHVAGAVRRPGVYRLRPGSRVATAVRRAGGATRAADLNGLNLAAKLTDGRQVVVPARAAAGAGAVAGAGGGASGAVAPAAPLSLNTATAEQLAELDGVGPVMAAKIVAYRQEHGGFGSVDELDAVPGIGPARMASLRTAVTV